MIRPVASRFRGEVEQGNLGRLRDPIGEEDGDDDHLLLVRFHQLHALQVLGGSPVAPAPHQFRRFHEDLRRSFRRLQIRARALDVQVPKLFPRPRIISRTLLLLHPRLVVAVIRRHHVLIPLRRFQVLAVHRGVHAYHESLGCRGDGRSVLRRDHLPPRRDHHRLPRPNQRRRHLLRPSAESDRALSPRLRLGQDGPIVEIQESVRVLSRERVVDQVRGLHVNRLVVKKPRLPLRELVAAPDTRLLLVVVRGGLGLLKIGIRVSVTFVEGAADRGDQGTGRILLHPILPESNVRVLPRDVIVAALLDALPIAPAPHIRHVPCHGSGVAGDGIHEGEGIVVPDTDIPARRFLDREQRLIHGRALPVYGVHGCVIVGSKIGPMMLLLYQAGYVVYYARIVIERLRPVKITAGYVGGYRVLGGIMILADQGTKLVRDAVQFVLKRIQLVVYLQYSLHPLLDPRLDRPRACTRNVLLRDRGEVEGSDGGIGILGYAYQIVVPVRPREIEPLVRFVQERSLIFAPFALLAILAQLSVLR